MSDCPICQEFMHSSTSHVVFLKCGHAMHEACHQKYARDNYTCPVCQKVGVAIRVGCLTDVCMVQAMYDVTEVYAAMDQYCSTHPVPEPYKGRGACVCCQYCSNSTMPAVIFCNDCEKRSEVDYHFYLKCGHCRGYNTVLISRTLSNDDNS